MHSCVLKIWRVLLNIELCRVDMGSGRSTSGRQVTGGRKTTATVTGTPTACIPSRSTRQQTTVSPPNSTRAAPLFSHPRSAVEEEEIIPILFVYNVWIFEIKIYFSNYLCQILILNKN